METTATPFLQLALALAMILTAAKIGGYLSFRLGQPTVLGELLFGLLIGPSALDLLHLPYFSDTHLLGVIDELAEIGVLLLMFLAGLDLHLSDLTSTGKTAALSGTLGVVFPLALGVGLGLWFNLEVSAAIFMGLILSATSVSISAQTLMELKELRSRVGISLLGAAVFDDILVVLGLSIFTALAFGSSAHGLSDVAWLVVRMVLFLGIGAVLGFWLAPRLTRRVSRLPIIQGLLTFTIVVLLIYAWAAEVFGSMAAITGAFLAGLAFSRSPVKERIENGVAALAYGLFVPIFFIDIGLKANLRELSGETLWLFLSMTVIAILGKVLGSGIGANLSGLSWMESLQLGIGMMSRGEVGLIVASVGIAGGIIPAEVFSAVVGVVIITTLLTPPMLRAAFYHPKRKSTPSLPEVAEPDPPSSAGSSPATPKGEKS